MIRINLARNRIDTQVGATGIEIQEGSSPSAAKEAAVKILLVILIPALLMVYEKHNLEQLQKKLQTVTAQAAEIQQEVDKKADQLQQIKSLIPQAEALAGKLQLLSRMSKLRLRELTSLDFIQSVIPERLWLNNIEYQNNQFHMDGYAVETLDLSDFVTKLDESAYFKDVIIIQDKDYKTQSRVIRDFQIKASVEDK